MLLGERNRTGSLQWWRVEAGDENGRQEGIKEFTFFCFLRKSIAIFSLYEQNTQSVRLP